MTAQIDNDKYDRLARALWTESKPVGGLPLGCYFTMSSALCLVLLLAFIALEVIRA